MYNKYTIIIEWFIKFIKLPKLVFMLDNKILLLEKICNPFECQFGKSKIFFKIMIII